MLRQQKQKSEKLLHLFDNIIPYSMHLSAAVEAVVTFLHCCMYQTFWLKMHTQNQIELRWVLFESSSSSSQSNRTKWCYDFFSSLQMSFVRNILWDLNKRFETNGWIVFFDKQIDNSNKLLLKTYSLLLVRLSCRKKNCFQSLIASSFFIFSYWYWQSNVKKEKKKIPRWLTKVRPEKNITEFIVYFIVLFFEFTVCSKCKSIWWVSKCPEPKVMKAMMISNRQWTRQAVNIHRLSSIISVRIPGLDIVIHFCYHTGPPISEC